LSRVTLSASTVLPAGKPGIAVQILPKVVDANTLIVLAGAQAIVLPSAEVVMSPPGVAPLGVCEKCYFFVDVKCNFRKR